MPELPDIVVYLERLDALIARQPLEHIHVLKPFVLRSVDPAPADLAGRVVTGFRRIGKRIVIALEDGSFIVVHLMIAGRLKWRDPGAKLPPRAHARVVRFPQRPTAAQRPDHRAAPRSTVQRTHPSPTGSR